MRPSKVEPDTKLWRYGPWHIRYCCLDCKFHTLWSYEMYPCRNCGSNNYDEAVGRLARPTLLARLLCLIYHRPQPVKCWEWKHKWADGRLHE